MSISRLKSCSISMLSLVLFNVIMNEIFLGIERSKLIFLCDWLEVKVNHHILLMKTANSFICFGPTN